MDLYKVDLLTKGGRLLHLLLELNRSCFWCSKKVKLGKYNKEVGLLSLFTTDYFHHIKSTHGLDPETAATFFNDYLQKGF